VLVDEFQDTDPVQWSILHTAFHGHRTLVLIGDPSRPSTPSAARTCTPTCRRPRSPARESTLPDNWRSDAELLRGARRGLPRRRAGRPADPGAPVQRRTQGRLLTAPAAVRLRVQRRDDLPQTNGLAWSRPARDAVAADVAAEVPRC
jgi:exodeoxyribonuclease V beta subunit